MLFLFTSLMMMSDCVGGSERKWDFLDFCFLVAQIFELKINVEHTRLNCEGDNNFIFKTNIFWLVKMQLGHLRRTFMVLELISCLISAGIFHIQILLNALKVFFSFLRIEKFSTMERDYWRLLNMTNLCFLSALEP